MKYYTYISDAKVDMLFPQVSHEIQIKVATEFGIDIKLFKAKRSTEVSSEQDRISRLEAVLEFLRQYGNLGDLETPDDCFEDGAEIYSASGWDEDILCYSGSAPLTYFALVGSAKHLIGNSGLPPTWSASSMNALISWFKSKEEGRDSANDSWIDQRVVDLFDESKNENVPAQKLDFLAKRLYVKRDYHTVHREYKIPKETVQIVVGTPLYIAMAD